MTITDTTTTTTPELAHVLTFPYADAFAGIAAVLPHASKDAVTPIIQAVHVGPDAFTTTDRYAVGQYTHGALIHPDTDPVIVPREAAEWLTKQTAKALGLDRYTSTDTLTVTITADTITIRDGDGVALASRLFKAMEGNYPPVGRLLADWRPAVDAAPLHLNGDFLARFAVSANKLGNSKRDPLALRVEFGKPSDSRYATTAPVRVTIGDRFAGLLQPVLPTR